MTTFLAPRMTKPLLAAVLCAAVLRLALLFAVLTVNGGAESLHCKDTSSYLMAAENLLATGRFANAAGTEIARTPGYPLFLIPGLLGGVEVVTALLQILVSCGTVALVYAVARRLFANPEMAVVAAWFYALEPLSIVYSTVLLSETLFTFLLVLSVYLMVRFSEGESTWQLASAAVALAAATYVRPITYFLPILLGVALAARALSSSVSWRRAAIQSVTFAAIACGLIGVWQVRNYAMTGYSGFSSITDMLAYYYQAASVIAQQSGRPLTDVQEELGKADFFERQSRDVWRSDAERVAAYQRVGIKGREILKSAPLTYGGIHLRGCLQTFLAPGAGRYISLFTGRGDDQETEKSRNAATIGLTLLLAGACAAYYLFSLAALLSRPQTLQFAPALAFAIFAYLVLISGGPSANSRFRHPMMPLISMTAACGLVTMRDRFRLPKREPVQ